MKTPESQPWRIRSRSNSLSPPSEMDVDTTPAQSSEPMKSNESNQKADELNEVVYGLLTKVNFRPDQDASWALRRLREVSLAYWRVLRKTYLTMKSEECGHLVRLLLFEA